MPKKAKFEGLSINKKDWNADTTKTTGEKAAEFEGLSINKKDWNKYGGEKKGKSKRDLRGFPLIRRIETNTYRLNTGIAKVIWGAFH